MKKVLIGLAVVIVIVAGGVYFFLSNINGLVQTAVEDAGTRVTGVPVTLADVDIDITGGRGALGGLNVANPAGFETDYAFNLGAISVDIDLNSIGSNPVVIKEIVVTDPSVIYELTTSGSSNIQTIQQNVEAFNSAGGGSGGGSGGGGSSGGEEQKVVIDNLYIRGAQVSVSASVLGGQKKETQIPEIHMTDIGKDSGGANASAIAALVIDRLLDGALGSVTSLNLENLQNEAQEAVEGAASEAGKAVEGAADAVKGLFNNN